ncbi:MAG: DASS family sodium-coupled anion symporter [Planctomycetes bacterium]|nr:DASS family sodium-coupled anion symporter [Planctomycetota bacterium]
MSRRTTFLVAGPLLGVLAATLPVAGLTLEQRLVLGITVWTAAWWVTEPIPIPITSLLPAILLPVCGIVSAKAAAQYYSHHLILLGGFFIAQAIERWGLHKRIALTVIAFVGGGPSRLVLGFATASAVLSMWISNTATALMLVPIAMSVVHRIGRDDPDGPTTSRFATCLLLAVAYGANVGGVGSLIGTPPNLIFASALPRVPGYALSVDFRSWLVFGLPVVISFVPIVVWVLRRGLPPAVGLAEEGGRELIVDERRRLGRMTGSEKRVLVVFVATALLWIGKGGEGVPGWSHLFVWLGAVDEARLDQHVTDSLVALVMAMTLFVLPSAEKDRRPLLEWRDVERVPWGMLFLFGGGFAIAGAFQETGLSAWIGGLLSRVLELPRPLLIAVSALGVTFLTEVTSNTATTNILMPILSAAAVEGGVHPLVLMLPAVIAVSFAFMLPVATAPNAIVFATGRVPIITMIRTGFILNLIGTVIVLLVCWFIALPYFGAS